MNNCSFVMDKNTSWGHKVLNNEIKATREDNPLFMAPAGILYCSLSSWNIFLHEHVKGYNNKSIFLKTFTFKKLHTPYKLSDVPYTFGGWLLLERSWANGPVLYHTGSNTLNYANVWIAPKINSVFMSVANIGEKGSADKATNNAIELVLNKINDLSSLIY